MLDRETGRQVVAQRLHAIALGGVMTGGEKADAVLPRAVDGRFGDLSSQVGIDTGGDGLLNVALCRASTPGQTADRPCGLDQQRFALQHQSHPAGEIQRFHGLGQAADQSHRARIARFQRALHLHAQTPGQLHVVTDLGVHIQRQMICQQTHLMGEKRLQAALLAADHAGILALPEIPMVNQHQIGPGLDRRIQQRLAGSHATDDPPDFCTSFDLEAVRTIIWHPRDSQVSACFLDQDRQGNRH